tara:strand:- start:1147 stop:1482 length:336 start_codon:yes stop_codon:yes gene_type:complete
MVEESNSSSSADSSAIHQALDRWTEKGQAELNSLFDVLFESQIIEDHSMKVMIFAVIGGYTNRLSVAWNETQDLHTSHALALSEVMSNPAVDSIVNGIMGNMVSSQVEELI